MTVEKLVGPATVMYFVSVSVAALWWASDLTARVAVLEHTAVTAERIARIETEVATLADATKDLRQGVNELVHELRDRDK